LTVHEIVVHVLVWTAVASELVCCVGIVASQDVFARLHYSAAATSLAPILLAIAVAVEEGVRSIAAAAALVVAVFLVFGTPALTIATARAARERLDTEEP
jgi:multisubunit Na+/H+ antiporter MnhG subunit